MKQSEIKELSTAELQEKLSEMKKSFSDLKFTHSISPLENPLQIRSSRRVIARIKTALSN